MCNLQIGTNHLTQLSCTTCLSHLSTSCGETWTDKTLVRVNVNSVQDPCQLPIAIMSEIVESAQRQMNEVEDILTPKKTATTIPFDPDATEFPTRKQLPRIPATPEGSAWVWGENDNVGQCAWIVVCR